MESHTPARRPDFPLTLATTTLAASLLLAAYHPFDISPLTTFLCAQATAWTAFALIFIRSSKTLSRTTFHTQIIIIILTGATLLKSTPVLDDDYFRYLWDGHLTNQHGHPWGHKPIDAFDQTGLPPSAIHVLDGISYPELSTIYSPTAQAAFALAHKITPYNITGLRLILITALILTIYLATKLWSSRAALLIATCPLTLTESILHSHIDLLGITLLILTLKLLTTTRLHLLAAPTAALAIGVKPTLALPLAFFFITTPKKTTLLTITLTIPILALPFILTNDSTGPLAFTRDWQFNGALFPLLSHLTNSPTIAKALAATLLILSCFLLLKVQTSNLTRAATATLILLALSPVINPWYTLWLLPFAAAAHQAWLFPPMALLNLSYAHGLFVPHWNLPPYALPTWLQITQHSLILLTTLTLYCFQKRT